MFDGFACFSIAILAFIVLGYQRGWRREVVSLVFVLLASALVQPNTSDFIGGILGRIPAIVAFIFNAPPPQSSPTSAFGGPLWSLIIFAGLVVLGYLIGNRVFPKPATPQERFIGVIPSVLSGVFILLFLRRYNESATNTSVTQVDLAQVDPSNYIPLIFVIAILAVIVALIAARMKKKK